MSPPHVRRMRHPGPAQPERITARVAPATATLRLSLGPAHSLERALVAPLAALGVRDAVVTLLSGPWAELVFCTGVPDPRGERLATYAAPETARNALLLAGSATLGRGPDDEPLVHAHGAFVAADGRLGGGHLLPDRCVAGDAPTTAFVTVLAGIEIAQVADAETNHRLLRPFAAGERADG